MSEIVPSAKHNMDIPLKFSKLSQVLVDSRRVFHGVCSECRHAALNADGPMTKDAVSESGCSSVMLAPTIAHPERSIG